MRYNWQKDDWPSFRFEESAFEADLIAFVELAGRTTGLLEGASEDLGAEAVLDLMIAEAMKSSAIEGEFLSQEDVKSSIRNHLGLNQPSEFVKDERAAGIGELLVSVRETFQVELTDEQLFAWHRMLMKGTPEIEAGFWRTGQDECFSRLVQLLKNGRKVELVVCSHSFGAGSPLLREYPPL